MRYPYRYDFMRLLAPQGRKLQQQQEGSQQLKFRPISHFSFFKRRQNISMLEFGTTERDS
eukprot:scaffold18552_cov148-Skeletonema_marinoi.AAC.5